MIKTSLRVAAVLLAVAPSIAISGVAAAQSALSDPAVPGSGYQIPEVTGAAHATPAAVADPSIPGDGYRIPSGPAPQAPPAPVTTQSGSYPSRFNQ